MAADLKTADIGVYGLGTMGSALALNLAEQGFRVAVSNREADWIAPFLERPDRWRVTSRATRRLRILSTVSRSRAASCS